MLLLKNGYLVDVTYTATVDAIAVHAFKKWSMLL
jgi:hypothetical protein